MSEFDPQNFQFRELVTLGYWLEGDFGDWLFGLTSLAAIILAVVIARKSSRLEKHKNFSYLVALAIGITGAFGVLMWGVFSGYDLVETLQQATLN